MDEDKQLTGVRNATTETGHTGISQTAARVFSIVFTVLIVIIPLTHTIRHSDTVGSIFPAIGAAFKTTSPKEFNETLKIGFHNYEDAINETSPVREIFLKLYKKYTYYYYRNQHLK